MTELTLFLLPEELHKLTGLTQPAAQIRWLRWNSVRHYLRVDGLPVVVRSALEPEKAEAVQASAVPDFAALRRRPAKRAQ